MKHAIYIQQNLDATYYPSKTTLFRPDEAYPEYIFGNDISAAPNPIYKTVRDAFRLAGMDTGNYGTCKWNPLGALIKTGETVLIKPNLVMDYNQATDQGTDCLYTQPAVVAVVIDYILIALKGKGKIIVGDAPMQECNYDKLVNESGYKDLIDYYRNSRCGGSIQFELVDFRELYSTVSNGIHVQHIDSVKKGKIIDLCYNSEFSGSKSNIYKKYRITNYDPRILTRHHTDVKNEYYISKYVLNADVVINMPKPKTHRKAGVTISLKNLVGINTRKEFLPHHTIGSVASGGDEYLKSSVLKKVNSWLLDKYNIYSFTNRMLLARMTRVLISVNNKAIMMKNPNAYIEGNWYGNNTISKTITDLNKILLYADKHGLMRETKQRRLLIIADMFVTGEKEGPVSPTLKKCGIVAIGTNPLCFDEAIATIMGMDVNKIPTFSQVRRAKNEYRICDKGDYAYIVSNNEKWDNKTITDINPKGTLHFTPTSGWAGHIELNESLSSEESHQ